MALPDLRTESFVTAVAGAMLALAASADAVEGAVREILGSAMTHCTMRCARTCSACYAVILAVSTSRALCNKLLQLLLRREHVPALPVIFTVNDNSLPDTDQIRHGLRAFLRQCSTTQSIHTQTRRATLRKRRNRERVRCGVQLAMKTRAADPLRVLPVQQDDTAQQGGTAPAADSIPDGMMMRASPRVCHVAPLAYARRFSSCRDRPVSRASRHVQRTLRRPA